MTNQHKRRLMIGAAGAAGLGLLGPLVRAQSSERVIRLIAKKFVYTPAIIELTKGETVVLELMAMDVTMGFNAPDFHVRTDMVPDKVTTVRLTADKPGKFEFFCDVLCGDGHEDMAGTIIVS
ncbi:MAG: cytochrome oxidase subunit periplasmic domain protein [Rhodocyclales bacterium]|nr:cytochrome oxidase subunit periplasmic domain protein [Rhodocyclales bacterium]